MQDKIVATIEIWRRRDGYRGYFNGINVASAPAAGEDYQASFNSFNDVGNVILTATRKFLEENREAMTKDTAVEPPFFGTKVSVTDDCPNPQLRGYVGNIISLGEGGAQVEFLTPIQNRISKAFVRLEHLKEESD